MSNLHSYAEFGVVRLAATTIKIQKRGMVMKKSAILIVPVLMLTAIGATALAKGPNGPGTQVLNFFSGFAWYQGTGSGQVKERWACDAAWENCAGNWDWYPLSKWPNGPDECDEGIGPFLAGAPDVGNGNDILKPGAYYVCIKSKVFRDKSEP